MDFEPQIDQSIIPSACINSYYFWVIGDWSPVTSHQSLQIHLL
ncbi:MULTISPECIES: hypothetical protein [unclassified Sphaerospermopsis]|nr:MULTISPECIES: hypothetical protein [unclassified Sphaerospermopsis]